MEESAKLITENMLAILLLGAGAFLIKFIQGRRKNLKIAKEVSNKLEEILLPSEKTYTWIGGVAGFKARYLLKDGVEVLATLTMIPRHLLLYYPFSILIMGGDKLFVVFKEMKKLPGEGHIVRRKILRGIVSSLPRFSRFKLKKPFEEEKTGFILLAQNEKTMKLLWELARSFASEKLLHVALVPSSKTIFAAIKPERKNIHISLTKLHSLAVAMK